MSNNPIASTSSQANASQSTGAAVSNAGASSSNGNPSVTAATTAGGARGGAPGGRAMGNPPDMHLDTTTGKWMFENPETGEEFEWNEVANAWLPVVDDESVKRQQAAYAVQGVDESVSCRIIASVECIKS